MSFIPDIRHRTKCMFPYQKDKGEKNLYWQGYLDDVGIRALSEFDYAIEDSKTFFDNIDIFVGLDLSAEMSSKLKEAFEEYVEMKRNDLGTSLIENIDDDKFQRIVHDVDAGIRHNIYTDMPEEE